MKALRREREMLSKLMQKRFSEEERKNLGVELRRLSFLKKTFSNGSQAVEDGRTLTQASRFSLSPSLSPVCIIIFREVAS